MKKIDVCYVIASRIGTIGIGSIAYHALRGIEREKFSYKAFCRGYTRDIDINKKNLTNYSFLEYMTYPLRFLEKVFKINVDWGKFIHYFFSKKLTKHLPECKIYHTWIGISPKAIKKAKENGAILVLEGANSHPQNFAEIMNKEYELFNASERLNLKKIKDEAGVYNQFDYIMCPSDFVYNSFLGRGFDKKKLIKAPYGVDTKRFFPIKKKDKSKKIKFVSVGSLQLRKGIQYLLQAWDELKLENAELIIVGRTWPDAAKIIEKYKNNKTIKFVGFDANPVKVLQESDVALFASVEEGSALVTYESMASGLPVIATFNTGAVVRDKKDGFIIPPRDVEKLKEKIKYFYDNPKAIEKMGKSARRYVQNFTWDKYGKRLAKEYKRILNEIRN